MAVVTSLIVTVVTTLTGQYVSEYIRIHIISKLVAVVTIAAVVTTLTRRSEQ